MFDWNRRPGLSHTEEEVERSFEEFYEDVHTEFLKFGEIINFKVCRNGSAHLRGNVYVHYKMLDSALLAYRSINGRYFAGKQVKCEYVGVTKWKIAICGEYMKTRLTTCSRGTACNFIHCFRNPGGDYEWADWDKPPPKYWVKKMSALFGCINDSIDEFKARDPNQLSDKNSQRTTTPDANRCHHSRRSKSRDKDSSSHASHRDHYKKIVHWRDYTRQKHKHEGRRDSKDTLERDCMANTMMLRNNSKMLSLARKSSDRHIRDEGLTLSEDEVCEAVAEDRDRSNNELHSETSCSRESNRSRHCNKKHNRMRGSEDESTENGGLGLDQVKSSCCTNWDKGRDEEEEEDREMKRMGRGDGMEKEHGHQKKRRRRGERENSIYSPHDYPIYIQTEAVGGFIDRWDPSLQ